MVLLRSGILDEILLILFKSGWSIFWSVLRFSFSCFNFGVMLLMFIVDVIWVSLIWKLLMFVCIRLRFEFNKLLSVVWWMKLLKLDVLFVFVGRCCLKVIYIVKILIGVFVCFWFKLLGVGVGKVKMVCLVLFIFISVFMYCSL